jgi:hypothetical protein
MDLYEAIEVVDEWLHKWVNLRSQQAPDSDAIQAIKICLEAARDKAGI